MRSRGNLPQFGSENLVAQRLELDRVSPTVKYPGNTFIELNPPRSMTKVYQVIYVRFLTQDSPFIAVLVLLSVQVHWLSSFTQMKQVTPKSN